MRRVSLPFAFILGLLFLGLIPIGKTEGGERLKKITWGEPSGGSVNALPFYLGAKKGFYRNEGIDLEITLMKTPIALAGITSGSLDYAAPAGQTIRLAAMGIPIKMVFICADSIPQLLVVRPEINSVKDLRGKVIAVPAIFDSMYFGAYYILKAHGLDPEKDVVFLPVGPGGMAFNSLLGGAVTAGMINPEQFLRASQKGFKQLVKTADYIKITAFGIGASNKKIREKRDEVKRMIRATLKAWIFVRGNKKESVDFMVKEYGYNPKDAPALYDMGIDTWSKDGTVSDETLELQIEIARKTGGDIKGSVPLSQLADFSILQEVHKELGIK